MKNKRLHIYFSWPYIKTTMGDLEYKVKGLQTLYWKGLACPKRLILRKTQKSGDNRANKISHNEEIFKIINTL